MAFINLPRKDSDTTLSPDEFNYLVNKINSLKLAILQGSGFVGSLRISDVPTIDGWYFASEEGVYSNAGGFDVNLTAKLTVIIVSNFASTFSIVETPFNQSGNLNLQGVWDANLNNPDISVSPTINNYWVVEEPGTTSLGDENLWAKGDWAVYTENGWIRIELPTSDSYTRSQSDELRGLTFLQDAPSKVWNVNHRLGRYPAVITVDIHGNEVHGKVQYIDMENVKISFSVNFSGKVFLS
jgi:hypothetical protein